MSDHEPDLTGMTFHEIAAKYGREAAINAGIEADPDTWGSGSAHEPRWTCQAPARRPRSCPTW